MYLFLLFYFIKSLTLPLFSISTVAILKSVALKVWCYMSVCVCVRSHLSPAASTVTCSAGSNLCGGSGDTVAHAEMASFLSANPCVLPHTSSPC